LTPPHTTGCGLAQNTRPKGIAVFGRHLPVWWADGHAGLWRDNDTAKVSLALYAHLQRLGRSQTVQVGTAYARYKPPEVFSLTTKCWGWWSQVNTPNHKWRSVSTRRPPYTTKMTRNRFHSGVPAFFTLEAPSPRVVRNFQGEKRGEVLDNLRFNSPLVGGDEC